MIGSIAAASVTTAVTAFTAEAARQASGSNMVAMIGGVAAFLLALGVIAKALHLPEIRKGTREFLRAFFGEPARPGFDAVPGIPEQLADNRDHLAKLQEDMHEIKGRDGQLVVALEQIAASARATAEALSRVENRANIMDERINDHRRRNEETAKVLQRAVEQTATDLQRKLDQRNAELDQRLDTMSADRAQNEAMRASLTEIGLTTDIPHPATTHRDQPPTDAA